MVGSGNVSEVNDDDDDDDDDDDNDDDEDEDEDDDKGCGCDSGDAADDDSKLSQAAGFSTNTISTPSRPWLAKRRRRAASPSSTATVAEAAGPSRVLPARLENAVVVSGAAFLLLLGRLRGVAPSVNAK
jgi:hypothetical protein